jgi:hypothetical protein
MSERLSDESLDAMCLTEVDGRPYLAAFARSAATELRERRALERPIPTSERMPDFHEMVLGWASGEWWFVERCINEAGDQEWWADSSTGHEFQFAVTYWLPVPPNPE